MLKEQIIKYLKLGLPMIAAYGISSFLVSNLFVNYSPNVRENPAEYTKLTVEKLSSTIMSRLPFVKYKPKDTPKTVEYLQKVTTQIAPGVRASEDVGASYIEYDMDNIEWEVMEVQLSNGKVLKFRQPKGMKKKPQEFYERFKDNPDAFLELE